MTTAETLLEELDRRGIRLWVEGDRIVLVGQRSLPEKFREAVRRNRSALITILTADNRPGEPLRPELIATYELDDHGQEILTTFARAFPGATAERLPRPKQPKEAE